jgi:AcrR family transcriptional regulator
MTAAAITMLVSMGRWEPDARGRLAKAALELYAERGFEQTTAAEIAERAGLTERTFFRHFADKREVLFGGGEELRNFVVGAVAAAPAEQAPLDTIAHAFEGLAGERFSDPTYPRYRQAVIDNNPGLQERELIKLDTLAAALAEALRQRGVTEPAATLTADAGLVIFRTAFARWLDAASTQPFDAHIRASLVGLKAVTAGR